MLAVLASASWAAEQLVLYDLEATAGGLVDEYDTGSVSQWQWGETDRGPGAGYDGQRVWSTGLLADYRNDSRNCLVVPLPDLSLASAPMFTFWHWYLIAPGDTATVLVDDGAGWVEVEPAYGYPADDGWTGNAPYWEEVGVELGSFGANPRVCLLFEANADGDVESGWFVDNLGVYDGDALAPRVESLDELDDTDDLEGPYEVRARVEDNRSLALLSLFWEAGEASQRLDMEAAGPAEFTARIPAQAPGTVVRYWVEASDGENEARSPTTGELTFRVYLPAPTGLAAPAGRVVAPTARLTWEAPTSRNAVLGYAVERNGEVVAEVDTTWADAPLSGGVDTFVVYARYEAGLGDPSEAVSVDGYVPALAALSPGEGFAGDVLRVALEGENLLLTEGEVQVDLGAGLTVDAVDVRDVDRAWVHLTIDAGAAPGTRALQVTTPVGSLSQAGAFVVRDAAERPRLLTVEPSTLRQGEQREVRVAYAGALAGAPVAEVGEGVVVESVTVDGDELVLSLAVGNDAPLGEHPVTVDDGTRFLTGVSIEVEDVILDVGSCASAPSRAGLWLVGAALLLVRRRR